MRICYNLASSFLESFFMVQSSRPLPKQSGKVVGAEDIGNPHANSHGHNNNDVSQLPEEHFLWKDKVSWRNYFWSVLGFLLFLVGVSIAAIWLVQNVLLLEDEILTYSYMGIAAFWGLSLLGGIIVVLQGLTNEYELSSERLFFATGLVSKHIDEIELVIVYDVRVQQSLGQRFWGIGDVIVFSGDETHKILTLQGVEDYVHVKDMIRNASQKVKIARGIVFAHNIE